MYPSIKQRKENKMAWFELDPDPTHDAIAAEHMLAHESVVIHNDWQHEAGVAQEMAEAGVRSNDEFVRRKLGETATVPIRPLPGNRFYEEAEFWLKHPA
jgi:hypothetical protein